MSHFRSDVAPKATENDSSTAADAQQACDRKERRATGHSPTWEDEAMLQIRSTLFRTLLIVLCAVFAVVVFRNLSFQELSPWVAVAFPAGWAVTRWDQRRRADSGDRDAWGC